MSINEKYWTYLTKEKLSDVIFKSILTSQCTSVGAAVVEPWLYHCENPQILENTMGK